MFMATGGTSAAAECTSADEETVTGLQRACGMSILGKYPAYVVHKGYEVSDVVLIVNIYGTGPRNCTVS